MPVLSTTGYERTAERIGHCRARGSSAMGGAGEYKSPGLSDSLEPKELHDLLVQFRRASTKAPITKVDDIGVTVVDSH